MLGGLHTHHERKTRPTDLVCHAGKLMLANRTSDLRPARYSVRTEASELVLIRIRY